MGEEGVCCLSLLPLLKVSFNVCYEFQAPSIFGKHYQLLFIKIFHIILLQLLHYVAFFIHFITLENKESSFMLLTFLEIRTMSSLRSLKRTAIFLVRTSPRAADDLALYFVSFNNLYHRFTVAALSFLKNNDIEIINNFHKS